MSLLFMLKAHIEFKRNFAKNNTNSEREHTRMSRWLEFLFMVSWELYILGGLQSGGLTDWPITAAITNTGIPSTVEHPHQVELTISIQLHTCWYLEYWSTVWHLCSSVNCDNWEMIGLLEAIIQELDFRGRFVSRKGYIHATFLLLESCAQVLSLCG